MDHDQRTSIAQQLDPVAAATIVKSIADIERDHRLAEGPLSDRMMDEIQAIIRKGAPEPWQVTKAEWLIWFTHPEWKPTKGLGRGDAWFEINEIGEEDDDVESTWIGAAVGAGKSALGLELVFRKGLAQAAYMVLREKAQAQRLEKIGLRPDATAERWFVPLSIDRLRLAKGFEENDFAEALAPVGKAIAAALAAKADLDALIELVRQRGRGK
jgi:hypothetical protein